MYRSREETYSLTRVFLLLAVVTRADVRHILLAINNCLPLLAGRPQSLVASQTVRTVEIREAVYTADLLEVANKVRHYSTISEAPELERITYWSI